MRTADGQSLRGFSLDGRVPAAARIRRDRVLIDANTVPTHIYFGWKPFSDANLVNREGLPASTFKIEVR